MPTGWENKMEKKRNYGRSKVTTMKPDYTST
jgi:hypothetical protein